MSNGAVGTSTPPTASAVPELRRIENRLDETCDMLSGVLSTALNIRASIIGGAEDSLAKTPGEVPEALTFVARVNQKIDRLQDNLKEIIGNLETL